MKHSIKYIAVAAVLLLAGCNDYLDKIPDNRTELDSKEKIAELLANAYPKANYISFCEVMSDNVGDKGSSAVTRTYNTEPYFWKDFTTDSQDTPTYYWNNCFKAIAHANMALEAIMKTGNKPELSALKGEALLCRAYAHFMLVTLFAKTYNPATSASDPGVPYVTEVETVVNKKYNRETVAKVYELIEKDLTEGLPLISDSEYKILKYHFNKAAANAFASRFYLFKKDYPKVVAHADAALGSNLTANLRDWNKYAAFSYYQLRQTYTLSTEPAVLLLTETNSLWGRYLQSYRYSLSAAKVDEFFNNRNVTGGEWLYPIYGRETTYGIPKFQEYFKKESLDATTGFPMNMVPLFTAEEAFFNRLEARARLDAPIDELVATLNDYLPLRVKEYNPRQHSLSTTTIGSFYKKSTDKENLLECILDLKRVDFMHEGLRWFDILRLELEVVHTTKTGETFTLKANDPRKQLQIPISAINNGIPKNPR